jgi:hypothetical protein
LLEATENALAPIIASVNAGRLTGADAIGLKIGRVVNKHRMAKHLQVTITDHSDYHRDQTRIDAEAALDAIYAHGNYMLGTSSDLGQIS